MRTIDGSAHKPPGSLRHRENRVLPRSDMKVLWCWRCRQDMPMLDEDEFRLVDALFRGGMRATKEFRLQHGIPLQGASIHARFAPVRKAYEDLTGKGDCHENVIMHQGRLDPGIKLLNKPYGRAELANKLRQVLDVPSRSELTA